MRDNAVVFHLRADLTIAPLCTAKSKMPRKSAIRRPQEATCDFLQ